ncbi:MAG: hypothetical protein KDA89_24730, partial [Planctomycetaceae bacterium]|nr:hypothetical protein [Planctomycetaceae bacterium]
MSKSKPNELVFKSYHLRYIDAEEAELQVMTQFGMRQNVANVSTATESQSRFRDRSSGFPQSRTQTPQPQQQSQQQQSATAADPQVQIASDLRLNALLVTGTMKQHQLVEQIVESIDVNETASGTPVMRGRKGTYLEVYQVKTADAREVSKTLTAMNMPGVQVVNEDGQNGRIHIMATERQHEEVAALIRQLDGAGSVGSVAVIPLTQMDPVSASVTLRSLFLADGDAAPTIETDVYGRRLIIRGSMEQITQIRQVLADLGEDGSGVRQRGESGMVRRFSLQGRNPDDFLKYLKQSWESQETTRITIIRPDETGPIRSRQTSEGEINTDGTPRDRADSGSDSDPSLPVGRSPSDTQPLSPSSSRRSNDSDSGDPLSYRGQSSRNAADRSAVSGDSFTWQRPSSPTQTQLTTLPAAQVGVAPQQPQSSGSDEPLQIMIFGDDLILAGEDEAELDRLEEMLDQLQRSLPFKPEYTVYYLQSADAQEAADMLGQFFPSSSVASSSLSSGSMMGSLGSSFSSMGSSLMDMTGLSGLGASNTTLKIIPDLRTNSLFMTGPPTMIRDAITFLKVLDSDDVPDSLKDMQPRQIYVDFADVGEVATQLKDIFKPYMEPQGGGRQQQQNPLAAMFGGGGRGGGGGNEADQQVRMTLGIDYQTSTLTVNSSLSIFDEVEMVVRSQDKS